MQNALVNGNPDRHYTTSTSSNGDVSFLDYRASTRLSGRPIHHNHKSISNEANSACQKSRSFFVEATYFSSTIKWTMLGNTYPFLGTFGGPTCLYSAKSYYALGTSKGMVLIFGPKQFILNSLVPKLDGSFEHFRCPVQEIVVSTDGTHLAASYQSGDIFLWDLNGKTAESNAEESNGSNEGISSLGAILQITNHKGCTINGIGFVGGRHTALIVSDNSGNVFYHSAFRTHLWSLTYSSKLVLHISNEGLVASQPAPDIKMKEPLHMVAVLTTSRFAIISTTPHPITLILEDLKSIGFLETVSKGSLAWHQSASKVAFSLNRTIFVFGIGTSPPFSFKKTSAYIDEPTLLIQWITLDILGILTISHRFLMLDVNANLRIIANLEFLVHDLSMSSNRPVAVCDNKFQLLTKYGLKVGQFSSWSDITLNYIQEGNYLEALKFMKSLIQDDMPLSPLIGLAPSILKRERELEKPFYDLALAALRFTVTHQTADFDTIYELFSLLFSGVDSFHENFPKVEYTNSFLERSMEFFSDDNLDIFFEVLLNMILEASMRTLPAALFKPMLINFANAKKLPILEDMIVMLDLETLDIDLAVKLCHKYELFGLLIYLCNTIFDDYTLPLVETISRIDNRMEESFIFRTGDFGAVNVIFDYLSFVLTGRQFPQNNPIVPIGRQVDAKVSLYRILFSGTCIEWPKGSGRKLYTRLDSAEEPAFPYFNLLMNFNTSRMLSTLNEIFEDSLLNEEYIDNAAGRNFPVPITRQYMIDIILDMMRKEEATENSILMGIFVACNAAKYPQFIRLSSRVLEDVVATICGVRDPLLSNDCQRALECLLSIYIPRNCEKFITELKELDFKRALFIIYVKIKRLFDILPLALYSEDTKRDYNQSFPAIISFILFGINYDSLDHARLFNLVREHFDQLVNKLTPKLAVEFFQKFDPYIHESVEVLASEDMQQRYLEELYLLGELEDPRLSHLKDLYFDLNCKHTSQRSLIQWLGKLEFKNFNIERATNILLSIKNYEALAVIHHRLDANSIVVNDMLNCIGEWFKKGDKKYPTLHRYLHMTFEAISRSNDDKLDNWTRFIAFLLKLYGEHKNDAKLRQFSNKAFQELFVRLAVSEASDDRGRNAQFWSILTNALEHQEVIMMKARDLRTLLFDVFATCDIEIYMSRLVLEIMRGSSVGVANLYESKVNGGWSVTTDECEVCGKVLWGLGLDSINFVIWRDRRRLAPKDVSSISSNSDVALVSFGCKHVFHERCLQNLGQRNGKYFCLTCKKE